MLAGRSEAQTFQYAANKSDIQIGNDRELPLDPEITAFTARGCLPRELHLSRAPDRGSSQAATHLSQRPCGARLAYNSAGRARHMLPPQPQGCPSSESQRSDGRNAVGSAMIGFMPGCVNHFCIVQCINDLHGLAGRVPVGSRTRFSGRTRLRCVRCRLRRYRGRPEPRRSRAGYGRDWRDDAPRPPECRPPRFRRAGTCVPIP